MMLCSDWAIRTIESVCKQVTSGGTPSRKNPGYFTEHGEGFPWVKTKELKDWWVDTTEESITQEGLDKSSAKLLPREPSSWRCTVRL